MFRKLILSAVTATATLTALTVTPSTADAGTPTILPHHHFEVLVSHGGGWKSHGVYQLQVRAEVVAAKLRLEGHRVEIRQF